MSSEEAKKKVEDKLKPRSAVVAAIPKERREVGEEGTASLSKSLECKATSPDDCKASRQLSSRNEDHAHEREDTSHSMSFSPLDDIAEMPITSRTPGPSAVGAHAVAGPARFSNPNRGLHQLRSASGRDFDADQTSSSSLAAFLYESDSSNHAHDVEATAGRSSSHMTVASDIEEFAVLEVEAAQPMPSSSSGKGKVLNDTQSKRKSCIQVILLIAAFGAAVSLVLVPTLVFTTRGSNEPALNSIGSPGTTGKPKDTQDTKIPSSSHTYPPFQEDLPAPTLRAIQNGPDSAEARANAWMWNDPYLTTYSKERQRQRFGLVTLYQASQGDQWLHNDHWLDYEVSECLWFSKAKASEQLVCDSNDKMLALDLHSNNLNGTLPPAFWLIKPSYIDLGYNLLQGEVPPLPADSDFLEVLIVSHNRFGGFIMAESGLQLNNVLVVKFDGNFFQGTQGNNGAIYQFVPTLQILNISDNILNGGIPHFLSHMTDLRYLGGGDNNLKGTMATELGLMTMLEIIDYSGNRGLTGTIPSELALLTNLAQLDIRDTGFTGVLPDIFCEKQEQGSLRVLANCSSIVCCSGQ